MKKILYIIPALIAALNYTDIYSQSLEWDWVWAGGGSNDERTWDNAVDDEGNYYIIGSFASATVTFGTTVLTNHSTGTTDVFLVKYDSSGNVVWANGYGTANNDEGRHVAMDDSGNVYMTGYYNSASITIGSDVLTNSGNDDIFVAKLDDSGNEIWAITIGNVNDNRPNGLLIDLGNLVTVLGDYTNANLTIGTFPLTNAGDFDFFFAQLNSGNGSVVYAKGFGGSGRDDAQALSMSDASGLFYIGGRFDGAGLTLGTTTLNNAGSGTRDAFIMEVNSGGTVSMAKNFGGSLDEEVIGIIHNSAGGSNTLYISGVFQSTSFMVGSDTLTNSGSGTSDLMIISHSGSSYDWAKSAEGSDDEMATGLTMIGDDEIGLTGVFNSSSLSFDSDDLTNSGSGTYDIFVAGYDKQGENLWAEKIGGTGDDFGYVLSSDPSENIYLSGWYNSSTITFDPLPASTNSGNNDAFIARSGSFSTGITGHRIKKNMQVYPNPSSNFFYFDNPEKTLIDLKISNVNGQLILEKTGNESQIQIDMSGQNEGFYYFNLLMNGTYHNGKLCLKR